MAQAVDAIITTRVRAARTFSTCSTVEDVYASLIAQLAISRPYSIRYSADARDLEERLQRIQRQPSRCRRRRRQRAHRQDLRTHRVSRQYGGAMVRGQWP